MLDEDQLRRLITPGSRVAVGDGAGIPTAALPTLADAARAVGGVKALFGWIPGPPPEVDLSAFAAASTLMGGYGLRRLVASGQVAYIPVRFGRVHTLLDGPLRPDVLLASLRRGPDGGWRFTSEVAWQRAAIDAGAIVAGIERPASPLADGGPAIPDDHVVIVGVSEEPPAEVNWPKPSDIDRIIAERVVGLLPEGAHVQVAPGPLGDSVLEAVRQPIHLDTGVLTDAAVNLAERGLSAGQPVAPYLAGTARLYDWADGRPLVHRMEHTHDPVRLAGAGRFIAVNTALQLDADGQINVESVGDTPIAGIGGQPDYAFAACRSVGGLSIVAVPTDRNGHPTLVDHLDGVASTPSHDIDVVITELGVADLRGLDRAARRRAIRAIWGA